MGVSRMNVILSAGLNRIHKCFVALAVLTALGCVSADAAIFTQEGGKLVGTGAYATAHPQMGRHLGVAISSDGTTAVVGGPYDYNGDGSNQTGAVWFYTRSGTTWTQQGNKVMGSGVLGAAANQGWSVAISADGNT